MHFWWGCGETHSYIAGGRANCAISVKSHLAAPITITSAFDLTIWPLGIYPINMLTYANETYKRLLLFVIAEDGNNLSAHQKELVNKRDTATTGRNGMEGKREEGREKLLCWSGQKQNKVWVETARWGTLCVRGWHLCKMCQGDLEVCSCWNV